MKYSRTFTALAFAATAGATSPAQAQPPADPSRIDAVVADALARYNAGLDALASMPQPSSTVVPPAPPRDITLTDAVALALEKNLDLAVERLNPQVQDFQLAAVRTAFNPVATSTVGERGQTVLPTNQLNGGTLVENDTTTYNFGFAKALEWGGGIATVNFTNSRLVTSNIFANFSPQYNTGLVASLAQPLLRDFGIDQTRQQLLVTQINREIAGENLRATVATTSANVRTAYWDLALARQAVAVATRSLELAENLVRDNEARVEVGTLAPIDIVQAQAEAASRRQTLAQVEAQLQTAQLALKRLIVSGTDDPLWRMELRPTDLPNLDATPLDVEAAIRRALGQRTDLVSSRKNLDSNEVTLRFWKNQSLPSLDLTASYGLTGLGGTGLLRSGSGLGATITGTVPGGYTDALALLRDRTAPTWNLALNVNYPIGGNSATANYSRTQVQRNQAQTRLRALELQVATEVTNAALTAQANLRRVDAARAARELAEKRLDAEQSKFEVGMSTNYFVVQAQRDLLDAETAELRALADYQKAIITFERAQEAPAGGGTFNTNNATGGTGGGGANTGTTDTTGTGGGFVGLGGQGGPGGGQ
jgi:outer membrane protein